jgi:hypothetical protein
MDLITDCVSVAGSPATDKNAQSSLPELCAPPDSGLFNL